MRIAYGKLGRRVRLANPSSIGGDVEVIELLRRLVGDGHTVDLVTRHEGELSFGATSQFEGGAFADLPMLSALDREVLLDGRMNVNLLRYRTVLDNAVRDLPRYDAWVLWLGDHNGPCWPYQKRDGSGLVRVLTQRLNYVNPVVHVLNAGEISPTWLCPDPRNVLDVPNLRVGEGIILAQYDETSKGRDYAHSGIELLAAARLIPRTELPNPTGRGPFGAVMNEGSSDRRPLARVNLVGPWLRDVGGKLNGNWRSLDDVEPVPVNELGVTLTGWRATINLPASCSGWATAKPWEAFASDTVAFAHPAYDDQDHVYGRFDTATRSFLRPSTPERLTARITALVNHDDLWAEVILAQRRVLTEALISLDGGYTAVRKALNA